MVPAVGHRVLTSGRLVAVGFALAALPLVLVRMPPVMDFPNHLTRI
jgi:hypothetical protein